MAKGAPASKRFKAKLYVQAVIEVPVVASSFEEALAAAKTLKLSDTFDDSNEFLDSTIALQGVENGLWVEY